MIRPIVMWKFKDKAEGIDRATNLRNAQALLAAVPEHFDKILDGGVVINRWYMPASFALVLAAPFAGREALDACHDHTENVYVVKVLRSIQETTTVDDQQR